MWGLSFDEERERNEQRQLDTLDKILELGSTPDWITPLVGLIQDAINGPRDDIRVDMYAGVSVKDVQRHLKRNGITAWGGMILDGEIVVSVPEEQSNAAREILGKLVR